MYRTRIHVETAALGASRLSPKSRTTGKATNALAAAQWEAGAVLELEHVLADAAQQRLGLLEMPPRPPRRQLGPGPA
jgi:hypothetical protein